MGQKTHPYGFRLGVIKGWRSNWFAEKDFAELLKEDLILRDYIRQRLQRAGVAVALSTNAGRGRSVVIEAIVSKAHGLPEAQALRAVTLGAAEILGVNDRIGSIEVGKDADLAIWRGHPLNTWSVAQVVLIDGEVVFDRRPVP